MAAFRSVIFDCDSTLSAIEGIDELAGPHRAEIAELTAAAMRGDVALEEVYGRRLRIVKPGRAAILALGEQYVRQMVPGARETIAALHAEGIQVRIMSGGLLPAVLVLARDLNVPDDHVAAVDLTFGADGSYAGFDESSALAKSGGKLVTVRRWGRHLARPAMMVGDGITDAEVRPSVDLFIAFAGVVARPDVVAAADHVVTDNSLTPVFALAMGDQVPVDPARRKLYEQGKPTFSGRMER
jgi:phosphoserine phosphatase